MKKQVETVLFLYLIAFMGLLLSSLCAGVISELVKLASFSVPIAVGTVIARKSRREREEARGIYEPYSSAFEFDGERTLLLLPLVFPFVLLMLGTSYLTVLILSLVGVEPSGGELSGNIIYLILVHAVVPAVLEEGVFRYLSVKLLLPVSVRAAVITSSLGFALFHVDPFSMPYALLAGVVLIVVDICFKSVVPSLVMHLVNNLCSVVFSVYCIDARSVGVYMSVLSALSLVSLVALVVLRQRYKAMIADALLDREPMSPIGIENDFGD